jgi:hypothetical protein
VAPHTRDGKHSDAIEITKCCGILYRLTPTLHGSNLCWGQQNKEHIMIGLKTICGALLVSATLATGAIAAMPASPIRTAIMGAASEKGPAPSSCPRRSGCECEWKEVDGILWCWPK